MAMLVAMRQLPVRAVALATALCAMNTTVQAQAASSCRAARDRVTNPVSVDGDLTIEFGGSSRTVFCYMMGPNANQAEAPYAYITLAQPNTAELILSDSAAFRRVTTTFDKVRVDEETMKIYTGDCELHGRHRWGGDGVAMGGGGGGGVCVWGGGL